LVQNLEKDVTAYKRILSDCFMKDLKSGVLKPLLERVREDETLMLAIRDDYINIYYRGGNIFEIRRRPHLGQYEVRFDQKYAKGLALPLIFPFRIERGAEARDLAVVVPELKYAMDRYFAKTRKSEREFQQLAVRENNRSPIANETDYFIVDIEIEGLIPNARYDMLAVRWLSHHHGKQGVLVPVLIEMKYGIKALGGKAGLEKHLKDAYSLRRCEKIWSSVVTGLEGQLNQLDDLGLLTFNRSSKVGRLEFDKGATPELIFLLANYNPASQQLKRFVEKIDKPDFERSGFNLLFFASCFAGYGMHYESMGSLTDFKREVLRLFELAQTRGRDPHA